MELVASLSKSLWHEEAKNRFADDSIIPILGIYHKKIIRSVGKNVHCSIFHYNQSRRDTIHLINTVVNKYLNVK